MLFVADTQAIRKQCGLYATDDNLICINSCAYVNENGYVRKHVVGPVVRKHW